MREPSPSKDLVYQDQVYSNTSATNVNKMLLPRQRDLYIKEYGSDFSKPSGGIYIEDKNESYNDLRY